jgi:two-component system response regulator LytT
MTFLQKESIDLCLLDLNLSGKNGFDILKETVSRDFHTIVISAYTEKAIEAYQYGILDFVPKPIDAGRLQLAFDRFFGRIRIEGKGISYLVVRKRNENFLLPVDQVVYFKADGYLVEIHKKDGNCDLIEKSLNKLEQILPERFIRVHRSYIVDGGYVTSYRHKGGGLYEIKLNDGTLLPLSSQKVKNLIQHLKV